MTHPLFFLSSCNVLRELINAQGCVGNFVFLQEQLYVFLCKAEEEAVSIHFEMYAFLKILLQISPIY